MMTDEFVSRDPGILGGTPVFAGTRVPVRILFEHFEAGDQLDDFLSDYPTVSREQAVALAALMISMLDRLDADAAADERIPVDVRRLCEDALALSISERVQLVARVWASIADGSDALDLTPQTRELLAQRLADHRTNPDDVSPWQEVWQRVSRRGDGS